MINPSQFRIQQLRNQIAQLDQKISENTPESPQLQASPLKKTQERVNFQHHSSAIRASVASKEEHLIKQREGIQEQLKQLAKRKQTHTQYARVQREPLVQTVNALQKQLEHVCAEYHAAKQAIATCLNQHQLKIQSVQQALGPLEQQAFEIAENKASLADQARRVQETQCSFKHARALCAEELASRAVQQAECVAQREEVEETLELLALTYPEEFEQTDESKTHHKLGKIKQKRTWVVEELHILDKQIEEQSAVISRVKQQLCRPGSTHELEAVETQLRQTIRQLGASSLEDVILDVNCSQFFDIDEVILREQLKIVRTRETQLEQLWETTQAQLKQQMRGCTHRKAAALREQLNSQCRAHQNRAAALYQWQNEVTEALGLYDAPLAVPASDTQILTHLKAELLPCMAQEEQRRMFNQALNRYAQLLTGGSVEFSLDEQYQVKLSLENKKMLLRKDLMKLNIQEKNLLKQRKHSQTLEDAAVLRTRVEHWNAVILFISEVIEDELPQQAKLIQKSIRHLDQEQSEIDTELAQLDASETQVNTAIEELLETQRQTMIASLEERHTSEEQVALSELSRQVDALNQDLATAKAQLVKCDTASTDALLALEQEEAVLHTQKQVIDASLKRTRAEKQTDDDTETRLARLGQPERPRSAFRMRSSSRSSFSSGEDPADRSFFEKILPLLEGSELYKKLNVRGGIRHSQFDPFEAVRLPPEACGYDLRFFRLHQSLDRIEVRRALKPGCDASIAVQQIVAPLVPQKTMNLLRVQQKVGKHGLELDCEDAESVEVTHALRQKCKACSLYPFSIALEHERRVEIVAPNYIVFKQWVNGITALVKNKAQLAHLRPV